ncbi:hypothetical protein, partial [Pseudomonas syringae]|uniref:hypothetical protein n=1 Tax=Pseudomonas syringae TaxID=317 RepID=UPI0034D5B91B
GVLVLKNSKITTAKQQRGNNQGHLIISQQKIAPGIARPSNANQGGQLKHSHLAPIDKSSLPHPGHSTDI